MTLVRIVKLKELPDALHPDNIAEGYERAGQFVREPEVGDCFWVGYWRTSLIQEIIDERTFRTYNSIYQWELIEGDSTTLK